MTIGDALKKTRNQKGITQSQIDKKVGISKHSLSRIENNRHDNPSFKTLCKLSEALQVNLSDIIRMVDTVNIPVMKLSGGNV